MPQTRHEYKEINTGHLVKNESRLWRAMYNNDNYSLAQTPVAKKVLFAGRYSREIVGYATEAEIANALETEGQAIFSFEFDADILTSYSDYKLSITLPYARNTSDYSAPAAYADRVVVNLLFVIDGSSLTGLATPMYHQFVSPPRSASAGYFGPLHFTSTRDLFSWGFDLSLIQHSMSVYITAPKYVTIGASETAPIYMTWEEIADGN